MPRSGRSLLYDLSLRGFTKKAMLHLLSHILRIVCVKSSDSSYSNLLTNELLCIPTVAMEWLLRGACPPSIAIVIEFQLSKCLKSIYR